MPGLAYSSRSTPAARASSLTGSGSVDFGSPALLALGELLRKNDYAFTTVTPATQVLVMRRALPAQTLRDVFGWTLAFNPTRFAAVAGLLRAAGAALPAQGDDIRSAVRFATVGSRLFVHSGFPTLGQASVFFGPDTYRFARAIANLCAQRPLGRVVDIGAGSGAGGILAAPSASAIVLADINPTALDAARTNLALNHLEASLVVSDVLAGVDGPIDTVLANPPFMADRLGRAYRDGGGPLGTDLAVRIVEQSLQRLQPGGRLLLYSGAPIVAGRDRLAEALGALPRRGVREWRYEEIDPDIFGEELSEPAYAEVERIAAVQLTVTVA